MAIDQLLNRGEHFKDAAVARARASREVLGCSDRRVAIA